MKTLAMSIIVSFNEHRKNYHIGIWTIL